MHVLVHSRQIILYLPPLLANFQIMSLEFLFYFATLRAAIGSFTELQHKVLIKSAETQNYFTLKLIRVNTASDFVVV